MKRALFLLALLLALPAGAEIYKCRLPGGGTEISSSPCGPGSSTVKAVAEEVVPERNRREAELAVTRMRDQAEKLENSRLAEEAVERQQQSARPASGPSTATIEDCLAKVARLSVDAAQRAELESSCRSHGVAQPVYVPVPVPYYPTPVYVKPRRAVALPTEPATVQKPKPAADLPTTPSSAGAPTPKQTVKQDKKTNSAYTPPSNFSTR